MVQEQVPETERKPPAEERKSPPTDPPTAGAGAAVAPKKKATAPPKLKTRVTATQQPPQPSMTVALFLYWVIPVVLLAIFSRSNVNTDVPVFKKTKASRPINVDLNSGIDQDRGDDSRASVSSKNPYSSSSKSSSSPTPARRSEPSAVSSEWPTAYQNVVETINSRRRQLGPSPKQSPIQASTSSTASTSSQNRHRDHAAVASGKSNQKVAAPTADSKDPTRIMFQNKIEKLRQDYKRDPTDLITAIQFADTMRFYGLQYHDGGTYEMETLEMYDKIVKMAEQKRQALVDRGEPTNQSLADVAPATVSDEVTLDYSEKSADGLLCALHTSHAKVYYMANMFEKAYDSYTKCLDIEPYYIDALNSRGSTALVLGRYEQAAKDFLACIKRDRMRLFNDAFTGMERILEAQEDAVPGGWNTITTILDSLIPQLESKLTPSSTPQEQKYLAGALNRFHHVMFTYHDVKTKDRPEAWRHLTESFKHKMSILPPWQAGSEMMKTQQQKQVFTSGFWPSGCGGDTRVPIFIIGFVRSGSTLLERVLDAHPMIVGTGENSVFNGNLEDIRNRIVKSTSTGDILGVAALTEDIAEEVVDEMRARWEVLDANTEQTSDEKKKTPKRFVDKMLTNYNNVGMIHMIYPNALILHVAREPMDTIFSAYKHEFPPGTLDYTSDFPSLAELYHAYRDIMEHWDTVLPGRVTHVRYEDMVNDMPGMARAIINATGLPWDDSVLDFHKKKHAVNTLSSTQVRKGVYKDSLKAWKRYETQLQPCVDLIGDRVKYDLKTSVAGYSPPAEEE
jgi:tetratricopeptide (TPR) repeat protein